MPAPALHPLDSAPISHTMPVPADASAEPDFLALPDAPAVVVFESADGRTVLIATTASARDLTRRRFGVSPTPLDIATRSARPDLKALCIGGRIHAIQVGSSLEADAVYLRQARQRLPHLAKIVAERWRAWFVHVDFDAEFPQWTKTNLLIGLVGKRSASTAIGPNSLPPGVLLGPLPDKDAAGRLIETVIDVFDLCRYHHLLVLAPKAAPCAYKEMGRCPAPCDGTESMPAYRKRTRETAEFLTAGRLAPTLAQFYRESVAFAERGDEAGAGPILKQAQRLETLRKPAFAHIASLHNSALLLLLPSPVPKHIRVAISHRGRLVRIADIDPADAKALTQAVETAESVRLAAPPLAIDAEIVDTIAFTTRWLFMPEKKRRGEFFRMDIPGPAHAPSLDHKALQRAAKSVLLRTKPGEQPVETHELEGEP